MPTITIKATAEELFYSPHDGYSADAELSVTFDLTPPERATRDYPGHPGVVELIEWELEEWNIYTPDGELVVTSTVREFTVHPKEGEPITTKQDKTNFRLGTPRWVRDRVAEWVESNDQYLIEQACEAEAEACEPY